MPSPPAAGRGRRSVRVPAFANASSCVSSSSCAARFSCCTRSCSCCVMRFRKSDATTNTIVCRVRPRSWPLARRLSSASRSELMFCRPLYSVTPLDSPTLVPKVFCPDPRLQIPLRRLRARAEVGQELIPELSHGERVERRRVARETHRAVLLERDADGVVERDDATRTRARRRRVLRARARARRARARAAAGHGPCGRCDRHSYRSASIGLSAAALRAG